MIFNGLINVLVYLFNFVLKISGGGTSLLKLGGTHFHSILGVGIKRGNGYGMRNGIAEADSGSGIRK